MIAAGYETSVLYYRFDASELLADRLSAFGDAPLVHALAKRDVMSELAAEFDNVAMGSHLDRVADVNARFDPQWYKFADVPVTVHVD